jgi:plasmid stabilization system protein ParE
VKIYLSDGAVTDLKRLRRFLAEKDSAVATRATSALLSAINSLAALPERGRPSPVPALRELLIPFGRSVYVLRYSYRAATRTITILRIWHGRERGLRRGKPEGLSE